MRSRELLGHVVGRGERRQREADLAVAARQRDLGDDELAGAEARPVRRRAALGREREAADRHEPGAGRAVGRAGDRAAGERAPGRGDRARSARARRPRAVRTRAERRERRAAAVGLLEAEPVLARPRARRRRPRSGRRRDRRATVSPTSTSRRRAARAADGALAAGAQLGARAGVERERAAGAAVVRTLIAASQSRTPPQ